MRAKKLDLSLLLACAIFLCATAFADAGKWGGDFHLMTLRDFLRNSDVASEEVPVIFYKNFPGLKVVFERTGKIRPIKEDKRKQLEALMANHSEQLGEVYKFDFVHEAGVREQGREYWLPI